MLFASVLLFSASTFVCADFPLPSALNIIPRADGGDYRLPTHAAPVYYEITVEPFFSNFTFDGVSYIEIEVTEEADNITLHTNELTISEEATLYNSSGDSIEVVAIYNDTTLQFVIFQFERNISAGTYFLNIPYSGILNSNNRGFYRGNYQNESGETVWFATTKFEPTYARLAFPCFDEPAMKAEFTISVIRPSNYSSMSNMNINYTEALENDRYKDVFQRSVKMSTYLVAFIVSDLANVSSSNHSIFAQKQLIDEGRGGFALDMSIGLLDALEDYTNVSYPIDKMYSVALPDDWFPSGAMEIWAIVVYKERYLLYKENYTSSSEQQTIVTIISHEYAHQWFGNLVSPAWWKYIWLNEGFATYFENYAASLVQPTWQLMEQFVIKSHQYAFESDSLTSTRAMATDASSPTQIAALFDTVIYDKAGSVIRMMEHFLTTSVYQEGLTIYLRNKSFSNAEESDLWNALQEALDETNAIVNIPEGETVESIMSTWTTQAGYPVVYVERDYSTGAITVSQSRFLLYNATHDLEEIFSIPINYATANNPSFVDTGATFWLTNQSRAYDAELDASSWLIVNKQETGYYRVNYDNTNWKLIIDFLKSDSYEDVHVLNRAQIVDDVFNLCRSGRLSYDILLDLFGYISQEIDYIPLYSVSRGLTYLDRLFGGHEHYEEFETYVVEVLTKAYESLGTDIVDGELVTERYNRINIIKWMCLYGGGDCREAMTAKLSEQGYVHPDLQAPVYCGGMRNGNASNWEYLFDKYVNGSLEYYENSRVLAALGCSLNTEILERFLNITLGLDDQYDLGTSYATSVFSSVYGGSHLGVEVTFNYFMKRFSDITEKLSTSSVTTILSGISARLTTAEEYQQLQTFISSLSEADQTTYASAFSTALSNINSNLVWWSYSEEDISTWFDIYYGSDGSSSTSSEAATTTTTTSTTTADATVTTEEPGSATSVMLSPILVLLCAFVFARL